MTGGRLLAAQRLLRRARGPLAGVLAVVAVLAGLDAVRPPTPASATVLVAAHDLPAGARLAAGDVDSRRVPPGALPGGAIPSESALDGRYISGPMRRGEAFTDVRLVGPSMLAGAPAGTVAVPVRFADAGAAAVVRAGDHIDVLATPPDGAGPTSVVAADVLVLAVPAAADSGPTSDGALVVIASTRDAATALARAGVGDRLSLALRNP